LLGVLLIRGDRLVAVVHGAVVVINVFAVVVVDRIAPAVIDPVREPIPSGPSPVAEAWVVRPVEVSIAPPIVVEPIVEAAGIVLPPVSNVVAMLVAPILPTLAIADATREILRKLSVAGSAR
jgi:hypothetical protein